MNKKTQKNKLTNFQTTEKLSIIFWIELTFVILFLFIAPFYKGLFTGDQVIFETPIYMTSLLSSIVLLILSVYFFYKWKLNDVVDLLNIYIWFIPLIFLISVFYAASYHLAMNSVLIYSIFAIFFLLGTFLGKTNVGTSFLLGGIIGSAYLLTIYGLFNWFGEANYVNAVLNGRLSNVFQYPDSYAAYLIGIIMGNLILINSSKKWYFKLTHLMMAVPLFLSFLLTSSRGAIIVLPILFIIYLVFNSLSKQVLNLVQLFIISVGSLLILQQIKQFKDLGFQGWLILLLMSLIVAIGLYFLNMYYHKKFIQDDQTEGMQKKKIRLIIPGSLILITFILLFVVLSANKILVNILPSTLSTQLSKLNVGESSAQFRLTFYKDSIKIFKDNPVFGSGGGAWGTLYRKYQSFPYTGNKVHSFYLNLLNDIGLVGLLAVIILFLVIIIKFFKQYHSKDIVFLVYVNIILAFLLHSIIDFDLSYVYFTSLLFLSLGVIASYVFKKNTLNIKLNDTYSKIFPSILIIASVILMIVSYRYYMGNSYYTKAIEAINLNNKSSYSVAMSNINKALNENKTSPYLVSLKANLLQSAFTQTKIQKYFESANDLLIEEKKLEPHNLEIINSQYNLYIVNKDYQKALDLVSNSLNNFPWNISLYEKKVILNFQLGNQERIQKRFDLMKNQWNSAMLTFNEAQKKVQYLKGIKLYEHNYFGITPQMALAVGQIYFIQGNYQKASEVLRTGVSPIADKLNIPFNREVTRWYLASLGKLNKSSAGLYNRLISNDPTEKQKIQNLIKSQFVAK